MLCQPPLLWEATVCIFAEVKISKECPLSLPLFNVLLKELISIKRQFFNNFEMLKFAQSPYAANQIVTWKTQRYLGEYPKLNKQ